MDTIDLHLHSTKSDGTFTPAEIVAAAAVVPLKAIALTDHDTVAGIDEALQASREYNIEVIPGIELSCMYHNTEIHILGLFIDHHNATLRHELEQIRRDRERRNQDMIQTFQQHNITITLEELTENNADTVITRAHFAKVLLKKGYAATMQQAFDKYLSYKGPFCKRKKELTCPQALEILQECGGISILAHPLLYKMGYTQIEELIRFLKPLGLKGIEAFHSSNYQSSSEKLMQLALKHHLLISGGSDFHGGNKPDIAIGSGRGNLNVPYHYLEEMKQARS